LLFFPCAFGVLLFSLDLDDLDYLVLFFIGSIIMRTAGCIINDIFDKELDAMVQRTSNRPLANKTISITSSLILLTILLLLGLMIVVCLSPLGIKVAFFAVPLMCLYPLIKRFSYFPQVFLGLTFGIGSLVAAATILDVLTLASIILYIGCIFWIIGYDTVYGFMDISDDKKIGIKSLSIKLEDKNFKIWLSLFYAIFIFCLIGASWLETKSLSSLVLLVIWVALIRSVKKLNINSLQSCQEHFNSNINIGILICFIILLIKFCTILENGDIYN
jgi:4-hydroxybenzoate polyprenyltransferase